MQIKLPTNIEENALTRVLLQKKLLTKELLSKIQVNADNFKQTLFQHLLQYHFISPEKLQSACVDFFKIEKTTLEKKINFNFKEIQFDIIKNNFLLPLKIENKKLILAISNPCDIHLAKKLSFQIGLTIELRLIRYDILYRLHNALISEQQYNECQNKNDDLAQKITHQLLSDAIHRDASDIHIEPYQYHVRIRFRIDGLLHEIIKFPTQLSDAITSCIKVLSHLDIAIKRMPQDGRLAFRSYLGFFKDCRVSTCPTAYGEKIVIRLLDANTKIRPINKLGLHEKNMKIILNYIKKPQGLILVTGPTGSGKTITLYTLLNLLNKTQRNISTIEDPIEMKIDGINQTPVNIKTGLTFSQSLRALLRQDPDVIMIGEIRDQETAEMAIRAAQTGHLVLSTLHTNSASEAVMRLCHMGIAPFHLASALSLVIAQRLIRKLCSVCKKNKALGCTHCFNGYSGRVGIFELMPITSAISQLMLNHASHTEIAKQNSRDGNLNLWESAAEAVKNGLTSLNEIYRVIQEVQT